MPYTPPSQRSPVASQAHTPPRRISSSVQKATETQKNGSSCKDESRPHPPRSNSSQYYLHKHRRSPSLSKQTITLAEQAASEKQAIDSETLDALEGRKKLSTAQDTFQGSQVNGKISGSDSPASSQSSSDEGPVARGRNRKMHNLEELHAAIKGIEQNRQGSPAPPEERRQNEMARDFSKPYLEEAAEFNNSRVAFTPHGPLSESARKISHSRSSTDAAAYFDIPKNKFDSPQKSGSDEDLDDDDLEMKPSLIRKKSGELVRPALRGRRRPSSMPGTPTYSKAVHFQDHSLEHVRTFLQVDRPIAVSAGSSPVEAHDDDDEFPFSENDGSRSPPYEWEMRLTNFPRDTFQRHALPARVEKIYLSADTRTLYGNVAVRNLAFHKVVIARFTLDYWKTTSEVVAEFNNDVRKRQANDGCDRFTFEIKLEAHANLEKKTMFFCVRYQVAGREFWDNNDSLNYQVDFMKTSKAQKAKQGLELDQPLNGLPRSKPSQSRPRSMPSFDDFGSHSAPFDFSSFPQPNAMVGDSPIRFKNRPPSNQPVPDAPVPKLKNPANQQAFGNRYDFGASLSAAIQASVPKVPSPRHEFEPSQTRQSTFTGKSEEKVGGAPTSSLSKPTALTSEKPSLQSPSYHELLDKYCFVRSRPTDHRKDGAGVVG